MKATGGPESCSLDSFRRATYSAKYMVIAPFATVGVVPMVDIAFGCAQYSAADVEERSKMAGRVKLKHCGLVGTASLFASEST